MARTTCGALLAVLLGCAAGSTVLAGTTLAVVPPGAVTVVGLGDSVMAGSACSCAGIMAGYAARQRRRGGPGVVPVDLGANGATIADLLTDLRGATERREVRRARVVVVVVGANDLLPERRRWLYGGCSRSCYAPAVAAMGRRLDRLVATLAADRTGRPGAVLVADYWNVFEDGDQTRGDDGGDALVAFGRRVTRLANHAICAGAVAHGARCVDLYDTVLGPDGDPTRLLASDGDHPNARGVAVIVSALARATPARAFASPATPP